MKLNKATRTNIRNEEIREICMCRETRSVMGRDFLGENN